jgi:murein DD-endopeptidase MepM/ murein hydrolase activator NlpD
MHPKDPRLSNKPDNSPVDEIPVVEPRPKRWKALVSWAVTATIVFCLIAIALWMPIEVGAEPATTTDSLDGNNGGSLVSLPGYELQVTPEAIFRNTDHHTNLSAQYRTNMIEYTVDSGDSIFGISKKFSLKPESILWANEDTLSMGVDYLSVGMSLKIPPTDGVFYKWKEGDRLDAVAGKYGVTPDDILLWVSNNLDIQNPEIKAGNFVMIPGGIGKYTQWVVPVVPTGRNGAVATLSGPGACTVLGYVLIGTNSFIWPAGNRSLSGNDYWDGHQGIDVAAGEGAPIYAADNGTVVYAGWNAHGYGNMVMIDHGTGYATLYAHLSAVNVACAVGVAQGQVIGYAGSTGNSTGPHLHFELRYNGGTINPWTLLH